MADRDAVTTEDLTGLNPTPDPSSSFVDASFLTYLVPAETDLDLDKAFEHADTASSWLASIPQRETLFFGTPCP
ncbi:hypothetical protein CDD83_8722 [Cordyceps sp. RAO-2017]|nr:hypothetical protein CDD83_8722 [Cordyceps sp. RAO-2017]